MQLFGDHYHLGYAQHDAVWLGNQEGHRVLLAQQAVPSTRSDLCLLGLAALARVAGLEQPHLTEMCPFVPKVPLPDKCALARAVGGMRSWPCVSHLACCLWLCH